MTMSEAISRADELRDNAIDDDVKAEWVHDLDCQLCETLGVEAPEKIWPEDRELMFPAPHDGVYVKYLVAQIDYYNQEADLYANDMAVYEVALSEARSWWRRNHPPDKNQFWAVM